VTTTVDPTHWLRRLDPDQWIAAAENELVHCEEALARRAYRPAVTHARRAAGMALNGVLVLQEIARWGRSYMEHITALVTDEGAPDEVRQAAHLLHDTPAAPPQLVTLGKPDLRTHAAAHVIIEWSRSRVRDLRGPPS
jgi:HEPN domain-containing protein